MIVEESEVGAVGAVGMPVKAGLLTPTAPRFARACVALFAPVPPFEIATGKYESTYCFGVAPRMSVGLPDRRRRPVIVPPASGTAPKFVRAAGALVAPVPPLVTGIGSVTPTAAWRAVISFLAVRKLFRTEAVVGLPNTGTVGSILLTIFFPPKS